jgi:hypothetical protein
MDKETFKKIVTDGDLIIITVDNTGQFIDKFNRNTAHIGIYSDNTNSDFTDAFSLSSIVNTTNMKPVESFHALVYGNIHTVVVIKSANDMKKMTTRMVDESQ